MQRFGGLLLALTILCTEATREETATTTRTSGLELTNLAPGGYLVQLQVDGVNVDSRWFFVAR